MKLAWRSFPVATIVRAVDGDTLECLVDQGFESLSRVRVRLFGIDAPEGDGQTAEWGRAAHASAARFEGAACSLWTRRPSFGRYEGFVVCDGIDIGHALIQSAVARPWDYPVGPRPKWERFPHFEPGSAMVEYEQQISRRLTDYPEVLLGLGWRT